MPSHFSTIGIPVTSGGELEQLAQRALKDAEVFGSPAGRYFCWRSDSGAELWLQADRKKRLMGANPHFAGAGRIRVGLTEFLQGEDDSELDGAFHGWAAPTGDDPVTSGSYPLVFDVPDAARVARLSLPRVEEVQVAAFAHELSVWESEADYEAAHADPEKPAFATRAFVPSGLFAPDGESAAAPSAQAILTGVVERAEQCVNELTGGSFLWMLVESLDGTFDVVVDPELLTDPPPAGAVVQGAFWLSGRLVDLDPSKRSLIQRLMNR